MAIERLFDLSGRVAVITGGAGLLGARHARALLGAGAEVLLVDRNRTQMSRTVETLYAETGKCPASISADITSELDVRAVFDEVSSRFGSLDILINNACRNPMVTSSGIQDSSRLENFSVDEWNLDISVSLTGAFLCCRQFGALLSKSQFGGVILNISSDLGLISPNQSLYRVEGLPEEQQPVKPVTYSVSKAGLIGLTRYLATYWQGNRVRANVLCPGGVQTDQPEEFVERVSRLIPAGRMANVNEYEGTVLYMVSDASKYMNGSVVVVDGGRTCW